MSYTDYKSPTAWLPVARNVRSYRCGSKDGATSCKHRSIRAACKCRKGTHLFGLLKNGTTIRITPRPLSASNGESCILPFPTTLQDYQAVMPAA